MLMKTTCMIDLIVYYLLMMNDIHTNTNTNIIMLYYIHIYTYVYIYMNYIYIFIFLFKHIHTYYYCYIYFIQIKIPWKTIMYSSPLVKAASVKFLKEGEKKQDRL